jgi:hypothetical protein
MLMATIGRIPDIFIDSTFDEELVRTVDLDGRERTHVLNLYIYAKDHGVLDAVPGLLWLVEQCRELDTHGRKRSRNGD